jgi:schlafen family protein
MALDDKPLADITEGDILNLLQAGLTEGPSVEYKSEIYERNDRGNLEFLLDVCMFANASGGTLLIGVPELRDADGQPTGTPDASAELGIVCANPEQQLLAYESRSLEAIDERLPIELRAVPCANGRHFIAVRVPNSLAKPHRVRYQGRTYFPSRRERQRYELDAREIKDLAMRTASQFERAETVLMSAINDPGPWAAASPVLVVALLPVFFRNFVVDLKQQAVSHALTTFDLPGGVSVIPHYSVDGLTRIGPRDARLTFGHNGLLKLRVPVASTLENNVGVRFYPAAIDIFVRSVVVGAAQVVEAAGLAPPALLGVSLWTSYNYIVAYDDGAGTTFPGVNHRFPILPVTSLGVSADNQVRSLCDLVHQLFGRSGSPSFTVEGQWNRR